LDEFSLIGEELWERMNKAKQHRSKKDEQLYAVLYGGRQRFLVRFVLPKPPGHKPGGGWEVRRSPKQLDGRWWA
jgi:hypothetical protein